ncbi:MAG: group II intron maturase-specific domain-containing protein [Chitinophagales bacterium]
MGHGFVPTHRKGEKGKYQFVVKKSAWQTFKQKLKRLTKKTLPMSFDERITRIKQLMRGWLNYFKEASIHSKSKKMDEWLRNRLRHCM